MAKINSVHVILGLFCTAILMGMLPNPVRATSQSTTFGSGTAIIGDEVYGLAGPSPVNCTALTYINAKTELDAQRAAWIATATDEIVGGVALGSSLPGPSGTPVNTPLIFAQPDGFLITATPVDLAVTYGFNRGSNAPGTPAFANVQINGSPSGCTMQDNAPKPSSSAAGDFYFNQLNNLNGLNAVRFTFSTPVQAFGAFFGDLETSYRGTTAFMRLLDDNGVLIADIPLNSTLGHTGGVAAENAQCSQTNVPGADVASQGLLPGCGNASTRWVGFVSSVPVAHALVVVGDNDALPGGRGRSEKLSFMGPVVVRALPTADVHIGKSAPTAVTVGVPFNYTIVVSNSHSALAAGVVITDVAPTGVTFNAVTGENCNLMNGTVTCTINTLAAGASTTISVQATANGTRAVTNTAFVAASNDPNFTNNMASATVTPLPALPRNACATPSGTVGASLLINEIMYRQAADNDEWIELYAASYLPGGTQFFISDNESGNSEYRFVLTIPAAGIVAGTYIVIHSIAGTADTTLIDGDGLEYFGIGGGLPPYLNNAGDNITLYAGASTAGTPLDYVAYGAGAAVNGPDTGWSLPSAPTAASIGQSIAAIHSGLDTNNGAQWALAGNSGTRGPATPGANNNEKIICNVALTKTGPSTGLVGAPFDYSITVSNTSGATLTGVVVTDTQPVGLTFNRVTGSGCNLVGDSFTCALGLLLPQASQVITVNAVATHAGMITNTAYTNAISDTMASDNADVHSMSFLPPGSIGDFIYLDINANGIQETNETSPLNNVPVTLTYADGHTASTLTVDGFYLFPDLPAGIYTVTVASAPGYLLTSVPSTRVALAESQVYTTADFGFIYATVNLEIAKDGVEELLLGGTFPYTLIVTNHSTSVPALDVVLTDTQPLGITFTAVGDARCALFAGEVNCNLGNLQPLAVDRVVITATATMGGIWVNTASITATNESHVIDNRAAFMTTVTPPAPPTADLQLRKVASQNQVTAGDLLTYTLVLTNLGPGSASNIQVEDRLPAGLLYHSSSAQQGIYDENSGLWAIGTLAPNTAVSLTIMTQVEGLACPANAMPACPTTAVLQNCAQVSQSAAPDPNSTPGNNVAAEDDQGCVAVTAATYDFDLALIKRLAIAQSATVQPGAAVTFTLAIQNQGQVTATSVTVIDYLPLGFRLHDSDWTAGPTHTAIYTLTADLARGVQTTVDITMLANTTLAMDATNTAEISRADNDNDPNNAPPVDRDSTPDEAVNNDGMPKDDVTGEDGKHSPTGDEDDHDLARVMVQPLVSVGNYVWNDANGDGQQQRAEQPLAGAVVALRLRDGLTIATDATGNSVANQTTAADGRYLFENLLPGEYVIKVTPPVGYLPTLGGTDPDNNDTNDSNGLPGDAVQSLPITVSSGDEPTDDENTNPDRNLAVDFGFYRPVTVGDRVWVDNNGNGGQDDPLAEPGIRDIVVVLYNASTDQMVLNNGHPVTTTTDNNGLYLFDLLPPGAYNVVFNLDTLPTGYRTTIPNASGVAEITNSDADPTTGQTRDTNFLLGGSQDFDLDLGIYRTASLGNYAWFDTDKDGLKDDDEPGIAGITVNLYDVQDNWVATILTARDGYCQFTELTPGDYYLEFIPPPTYTFTVPDMDGEFNSDADPSNGRTVLTALASGENDQSWGVGFVSPATGEDETAEPKLVNYLYLPWIKQ